MLVDEDAVADIEAGILGQFEIGKHADADDDEVGRDRRAGQGLDRDDAAPLPDDAADGGVEADVGAPAAVKIEEMIGDRRGDDAAHQPRSRLEHGNSLAEVARRGGDLEADEAAADDHHVARPMQAFAKLPRVVDVAEREDAIEGNALDRRQPRPGADGERKLAEGDGGTVGEDDLALAEIDAGRLGAEAKLDRVLFVEGLQAGAAECRGPGP